MGDDWRHLHEDFQVGPSIIVGFGGNTITIVFHFTNNTKCCFTEKKDQRGKVTQRD